MAVRKWGEQCRRKITINDSRRPKEGLDMQLMEYKGAPDTLLEATRKNSSLCRADREHFVHQSP